MRTMLLYLGAGRGPSGCGGRGVGMDVHAVSAIIVLMGGGLVACRPAILSDVVVHVLCRRVGASSSSEEGVSAADGPPS